MRTNLIVSLVAVFLFLSLTPAAAQSNRGAVAGRVIDVRGGVLQGARVDLQPAGATAVTNNQGEFRIPNVESGTQKLTISFVGFATYSSEVTVAAGQTAQADATMQVGSVS